MTRRIRIGIDVGGTFTHAVAIETETFDLIATQKIPTTHRDARGVAGGIVESLFALLKEGNIASEEIAMIAHSTTQATNALLEGDVAPVGILGMAAGLGRRRANSQTRIGDIELAPGRYLRTYHTFLDVTGGLTREQVAHAVSDLRQQGAQVIVATCAFSIEEPHHENLVAEYCRDNGILVTTGCEISQLYGLRARTRTAVINASMLPRMLETANMTEASVREAGISAPLMIMRSDGGIMDIDQMRRRPILTMLSGPAAGVAAALMYARITDGVFLEVGGTSTDISAIRNGKSLVKSATVGGHRLYLRTLDVRTLGVAGGSIPRVSGTHIHDVGPRSAHIANVHYSAFEANLEAEAIQVSQFCPREGDPEDYVRMEAPGHDPFSVTPTCASNALGLVADADAAQGSSASATVALEALGQYLGRSDNPNAIATELLDRATRSVVQTVEHMIEDYELDPQLLTLSGGGGGASTIVPFTARRMNLPFEIAQNAAVISAIGAALALVRDTIEKTVINPTDTDVLQIRKDAEEAVVRMGANPESVEVEIEIDAQKNILRATATGTTELRTRELGKSALTDAELEEKVRQSIRGAIDDFAFEAKVGGLSIYRISTTTRHLLGLVARRFVQYRVIDQDGIIRLQLRHGDCLSGNGQSLIARLGEFFEKHTIYGDAGRELPDLFVVYRGRILDMSGLISLEQIQSLLQVEFASLPDTEPVAALIRRG